jgi:hypothetical protein
VSVEKEQGTTAVKGDDLYWVEQAETPASSPNSPVATSPKKADSEIIAGNDSKWKMTKNHK